jgi:hypothetical protein
LDVEALKKEMPVLDEETQRSIYGGYDANDCWWRCIAYLKGDGNYSADDAYALASAYYGSSFSSDSYAFSGNRNDFNSYISGYVTCPDCGNYVSGQILVFNPNEISSWAGISGTMHAVVVTGRSGGSIVVYDPQNREHYMINASELNNSSSGFYVNVR